MKSLMMLVFTSLVLFIILILLNFSIVFLLERVYPEQKVKLEEFCELVRKHSLREELDVDTRYPARCDSYFLEYEKKHGSL